MHAELVCRERTAQHKPLQTFGREQGAVPSHLLVGCSLHHIRLQPPSHTIAG